MPLPMPQKKWYNLELEVLIGHYYISWGHLAQIFWQLKIGTNILYNLFVAFLTVFNKPLIYNKQISHLRYAAAISVVELFHLMKVGFTLRVMLSKRKESHGFQGIIYKRQQNSVFLPSRGVVWD